MANNRMFLVCKACRDTGMKEEETHFMLAKSFGSGYYTTQDDYEIKLNTFLGDHNTCSMGGIENEWTANCFVLEYEQNAKEKESA